MDEAQFVRQGDIRIFWLSLGEILQILSIVLFEKVPVKQAFTKKSFAKRIFSAS